MQRERHQPDDAILRKLGAGDMDGGERLCSTHFTTLQFSRCVRTSRRGMGAIFTAAWRRCWYSSPPVFAAPMIVDELLTRFDKGKKSGPNKWVARCPAHEDRSPSLAIKEGDDGVVLLHCFAGCSVDDVCGAIGIELMDLFPPSDKKEWSGD